MILSGPTSPLEGSPTTLGPPPWKYISSSRFVTPYTKPGIFFAARTWAYKRSMTFNFQILKQLEWGRTTKPSRASLPDGESVVISEGFNTPKVSRMR